LGQSDTLTCVLAIVAISFSDVLAFSIDFCYTSNVVISSLSASYRNQGEAAMTTRTPTRKTATTEETDAQAIAEIVAEADTTTTPAADLDTLIAQKRALDAQIKAARASQPTMSKLDRVIARQTADNGKWLTIHLRNRVAARVNAGQDMTEAVDAVLAQYRALLLPPTE
jgi:hypothetical protein